MDNELRKFRDKLYNDLDIARAHQNDSPAAKDAWKKAVDNLRDLNKAIRNGANTLVEIKMAFKDNTSLVSEINKELGVDDEVVVVEKTVLRPEQTSDDVNDVVFKEENKLEEVNVSDGGVFSARLEALINSALQDGVLTEQKNAILKKRVEKEGEDWDEVEMIINARLKENLPKSNSTPPVSTTPKQQSSSSACSVSETITTPNSMVTTVKKTTSPNDKANAWGIPDGLTMITKNKLVSPKESVDLKNTKQNIRFLDLSQCTQLKVIDESAFSSCSKLETILFPSSLKKIGDYAFKGCNNLKVVDFSRCDKLEIIGERAFYDCKNLTVMDFSHCISLNHFDHRALGGCDNIRIIDFSGCIDLNFDGILDLPVDSKEWKLILPSGQKVFNAMFVWDQFGYNVDTSNCKNITSIGFFKRMKMKEIVFPDSIDIIGTDDDKDGLFYNCEDLKTIVMPAALKEIKPPLGKWMEQLKKVDFSKVRNLKTIPKAFIGSGCDKLRELIIPQGVVEIEDDAFVELHKLKRLFLPPTLESIGDLMQRRVSVYCFSPSLEELEPIVYGWDDDEDDEDDRDEELEELEDKKKMKINFFVLPQYLDKYIAQRKAERIPEDVLVIDVIPEEYLYYYDN